MDIENALANGLVLGPGITGCCVGSISLPTDSLWAISITILEQEMCGEGEEKTDHNRVEMPCVEERRKKKKKEMDKKAMKKRKITMTTKEREEAEEVEKKKEDTNDAGKGEEVLPHCSASEECSPSSVENVPPLLPSSISNTVNEESQSRKRVVEECYDDDYIAVRLGSSLDNLSLLGSYHLIPNPETGTVLHDVQYVLQGRSLAFRFDFSANNATSSRRLVVETGEQSLVTT